ncbi:MAG: response regulator [Pseudomonadota bacterium]
MSNQQRILLVDDDIQILQGLKMRLSATGFQVETAENGEEGLAAAQAARPDLIVIDINMPIMDGFTMLSRLREDASMDNTPVIMLSANVSPKMKKEGLKRGARCFMEKPYDSKALVQTIQSTIRQSADLADISA